MIPFLSTGLLAQTGIVDIEKQVPLLLLDVYSRKEMIERVCRASATTVANCVAWKEK